MTFVVNGRPDPDDKETILSGLISAAEEAFGREFTPTEVSVIRAFYDPIAGYLATQQQDIAQVLDSAQIDHAEDEALDLLAALIGVRREQAEPATTRLQFFHDTPVTRDYSIPSGTEAQTDSANFIRFATDENTTLHFLDGFEAGSLTPYTGDTGDFTFSQSTVYDGSNSLECGSTISQIINVNDTIEYGSTFHTRLYLNQNTAPAFLFGVQDGVNYYQIVVDDSQGEVRLELVDGGSTTVIHSEPMTIPTGEWSHLQLDWDRDGEYTITLYDSTQTVVETFTASESIATFTEGGYGIASEDTTASKFFDNITMSRVSVDATATTAGSDTNVGSDTLVVLSDTLTGIDDVTNGASASGGRDRESDDDFRERAKTELSDALRATLPALVTRLSNMDETRSVTVIDNDTNSADGDGRPGHSFEAVVDVDSDFYEEVAEIILNTKAVGDTSVGGYAGNSVSRTLTLTNGQDKEITFSTPTQVKIYVDVDLTKTENYAGDDQVRDNIVQYTGGTLSSGGNVDGELEVGDDVIYNQVAEAVMDVQGVYDFSNLEVGTSASPTGTSNISIINTEMANSDATDTSIDVTSSDV